MPSQRKCHSSNRTAGRQSERPRCHCTCTRPNRAFLNQLPEACSKTRGPHLPHEETRSRSPRSISRNCSGISERIVNKQYPNSNQHGSTVRSRATTHGRAVTFSESIEKADGLRPAVDMVEPGSISGYSRPMVLTEDRCTQKRVAEKVPVTPRLNLISDACIIPHPDKINKGGEDAFFKIPKAVGVFDGVGGTMEFGIDSGIFAKQLAKKVKRKIQSKSSSFLNSVTTGLEEVNVQGSSTICIAAIRRDILTTVNVGDSCVMIVRGGGVVYRSLIQTHYFNCPFQVCDNKRESDVKHAAVEEFHIIPGDILVMGSDGLWDNMYTDAILDHLSQFPHSIELSSPAGTASWTSDISVILAEEASYCAASSEARTPFADGSMKEGQHYIGGKMDDITVIVGVVVAASS